MNKYDFLNIVITFLVGFFLGGFWYITGGAATTSSVKEVPVLEKLSEFEVVSEVYGGCQKTNSCPTFRVTNDGSYRYFRTPTAGAEQVLRQGVIPIRLLQQLKSSLTDNALKTQSKKTEPAFCNSFADGIDVRYEITLDGNVYKIDSCGTAVDENDDLWTTLQAIWDYFEKGE